MTDHDDGQADDLADDPDRRFLRGSMWDGRRGRRSTLAGASLTDPNPPTPPPAEDPDA